MGLLADTISRISPPSGSARAAAEERLDILTMPPRALGAICDLAVRLAGIAGTVPPPTSRKRIVVMAGDHGVVDEGVSPHGREVTWQMVANMAAGGAGVNVLARLNGAQVLLADFGMESRDERLVQAGLLLDRNVGKGTANMALGPAMSRAAGILAIERGIALAQELAGSTDVFATGEMGIGNSTPATAIAAVLTGRPVAELCGPGGGLPASRLGHKARVIAASIELNRPDPADALDVLSKVGGYEIAGLAGLILGAASRRKPVAVDGFISSAGAMIAALLCPVAREYIILAHASAEPGHAAMARWLGQRPLLDLGMRLGEGTGAALAFNIIEAAARILTEMATFESAGVTAKGI